MNVITIEFCKEDWELLTSIRDALLKMPNCDSCVKSATEYVANRLAQLQPAESPQEAAGEAKEETLPPAHPGDETAPWEEPAPATAAADDKSDPVIDEAQIRAKLQQTVIRLATGGKKAEAKNIVSQYGERVSAIPVDKLTACLAELEKLEKSEG